ncbi:hypothetical protein [Cupriavidus sp. AcVe19-6a]|uniref:hypothetical protein n=1 Tax=Cupriavidus sp. AcVe19-6a TaxID=2821358 RepID=UPI001AE463F0|nr:hypothetical protein [Cupriavidus sp. AcVe19-6a]MBP0635525.1 hypothetical protein [Cupriavidus sp. AcVe19-6a]
MSKALRVVEKPAPSGDMVPVEAEKAIAQYNSMVLAIKECHSLDVAAQMQSQAAAMAYYAHEAQDVESERLMREIRIRAQRRCGELLIVMKENGQRRPWGGDNKKSKSDDRTLKSSSVPSLNDLGIPKQRATEWQAIAKIPEQEFEQHLSNLRAIGEMPITHTIAALGKATKPRAEPEMATPDTPVRTEPPPPPRTPELDARTLLIGLNRFCEIETDPAAIVAQYPDWERDYVKERLDKSIATLVAIQQAWGE